MNAKDWASAAVVAALVGTTATALNALQRPPQAATGADQVVVATSTAGRVALTAGCAFWIEGPAPQGYELWIGKLEDEIDFPAHCNKGE